MAFIMDTNYNFVTCILIEPVFYLESLGQEDKIIQVLWQYLVVIKLRKWQI